MENNMKLNKRPLEVMLYEYENREGGRYKWSVQTAGINFALIPPIK